MFQSKQELLQRQSKQSPADSRSDCYNPGHYITEAGWFKCFGQSIDGAAIVQQDEGEILKCIKKGKIYNVFKYKKKTLSIWSTIFFIYMSIINNTP